MKEKVLCLFIILIFSSGCLDSENESPDEDESDVEKSIEIIYHATINPEFIGEYSVNIPLIVFSNWPQIINGTYPGNEEHEQDGIPVNINDNYEIINGSGTVSIINTSYGYAFRVNATDYLEINIYSKKMDKTLCGDDGADIRLSLVNDSNKNGRKDDEFNEVKYWVYCNQTDYNRSINLSINLHNKYSVYSFHQVFELSGDISRGWVLIDGEIYADAD